MCRNSRQLHLGVIMAGTGNFVAGWRYPGATNSAEEIETFKKIAEIAERGKFDMLFVADGLAAYAEDHPSAVARLDPVALLSALSSVTKHIGLAGTASTTFSEPYNIARSFASLDHISGGRAAWNVVTSTSEIASANFGKKLPPHKLRYQVADEFVEVVRRLWDSWEPDALVRNPESGVYVDPGKMHTIDFAGQYFTVRGPLNSSRCPQGQPIIIQAGSSESGQALAAKIADVVFTIQQNIDDAKIFYRDLKKAVAEAGRNPDHCRVLPGFFPVIGASAEEAQSKLDGLMRFVDDKIAIGMMSDRLGHDLSKYPLDGPVPDFPDAEGSQGFARVLVAHARRENLSMRQLYNLMTIGRGYIVACGTASQIADTIEQWFLEHAADGFMVTPSHFPAAFDEFVDLVVPELQRRGLFRKEYSGSMLRDHLNIPVPSPRRAHS